jgi:anti-sigma factor RsiW
MSRVSMTCRDGVLLLAEYVDGVLAAARRRAVDVHVRGCVRCQRFVASYVATPRVLREATEERMPDRLRRKLTRKLATRRGILRERDD